MRFDAVFFDSGGTLWVSPAAGAVPPGTSGEEVQARRGARLACALRGLGHAVDEPRLEAVLAELEPTCPRRFGATYTYTDLVLAVGQGLRLPLVREEAILCADAYVGPRYRSWLPEGLEQTLRTLAGAGVHLGVISNTYIPGCCVDRLLAGVDLLRYLSTRVYSGDAGLSKPDPRIFILARDRAGLAGKRILYVGDKVDSDIAPARALGWSAALFRSSAASSDGLADFEFDRMSQLPQYALADG